MGMNLSRLEDGEVFECTNGMWGIIMASAYKTGWTPLGTIKLDENDNPDTNWDKNDYSSHQGQIVTQKDAYQMSNALMNFVEIEKDKIDQNELRTMELFLEWLNINSDLDRSIDNYPGFEIH